VKKGWSAVDSGMRWIPALAVLGAEQLRQYKLIPE
jgi:hypothetical protein